MGHGLGQELGEILFELPVVAAEFRYPLGQRCGAGEASGQALQDDLHRFLVAVRFEPASGDHAWGDALQSGGKKVVVLFENPVEAPGELLQRDFGVVVPVPGEEVIVKDIDEDRAAVTVGGIDPPQTAARNGIALGETVDAPVSLDAAPDRFRPTVIETPLDEIPQHAAEQTFFRRLGEIEVKQVVQKIDFLLLPKAGTEQAPSLLHGQLQLFRLLGQPPADFGFLPVQIPRAVVET